MKHYLTFKDENSDKFWQIETTGKSFTVTYGKTGSLGASQTKKFLSEKECQKEAEKLVNEKLKKGYSVLRKNNNKKSVESINPLRPTTSPKSNSHKSAKKQSTSEVLINEVQVADDYPFYKNYNSEYVELSNNRILEVQAKRLTIYNRKADKYTVDSTLSVDLSKVGQTTHLSVWDKDVVLLFSTQALYVIDASGKVSSKPVHISLKSKWQHVSIMINDKIHFFGGDSKKRGLYSLNLKAPEQTEFLLSEIGETRGGLVWQDKFFFAHHEGLIVAAPFNQPKIIHKVQMSFAWPTVVPIDSTHILILDREGAYGRAVAIFNIEARPKKVQEVLKNHSAKLWVLKGGDLWLFTKKGADELTCHFSHYTWNGKEFDEQFSKKLSIPGRGYVFTYLHKSGNGFRLVGFKTGDSKKRIVWDLISPHPPF